VFGLIAVPAERSSFSLCGCHNTHHSFLLPFIEASLLQLADKIVGIE